MKAVWRHGLPTRDAPNKTALSNPQVTARRTEPCLLATQLKYYHLKKFSKFCGFNACRKQNDRVTCEKICFGQIDVIFLFIGKNSKTGKKQCMEDQSDEKWVDKCIKSRVIFSPAWPYSGTELSGSVMESGITRVSRFSDCIPDYLINYLKVIAESV